MRQSTPLRSIVADIQDTLNIRWIFSNIYVIRSLKKPARHVRTFLLRASEFQKLLIQYFLSTLHSSAAGYVCASLSLLSLYGLRPKVFLLSVYCYKTEHKNAGVHPAVCPYSFRCIRLSDRLVNALMSNCSIGP
jgi:hypothetical protein